MRELVKKCAFYNYQRVRLKRVTPVTPVTPVFLLLPYSSLYTQSARVIGRVISKGWEVGVTGVTGVTVKNCKLEISAARTSPVAGRP